MDFDHSWFSRSWAASGLLLMLFMFRYVVNFYFKVSGNVSSVSMSVPIFSLYLELPNVARSLLKTSILVEQETKLITAVHTLPIVFPQTSLRPANRLVIDNCLALNCDS